MILHGQQAVLALLVAVLGLLIVFAFEGARIMHVRRRARRTSRNIG